MNGWSHIFEVKRSKLWDNRCQFLLFIKEMEDKFGEWEPHRSEGRVSQSRWRISQTCDALVHVYFRDSKDALLFKLTWL